MTDEAPDRRSINDAPVTPPPGLVPARSVLTGTTVRLEPIDPARHTAALYRAGHTTQEARRSWAFEGIWFNHMIVKGRNRDTAWYSILDTEWPAVRTAITTWLDAENFDATGLQRRSLSAMTAAVKTMEIDDVR
jgi:hypothetical protein